ncbi:MAG: hypothetical protein ACK4N5_17480, partial [Myxococcales bacterium]
MTTIRRMGEAFAADRKITRDEAQALVREAQKNGVVSKSEKLQLRELAARHRNLFEPGAWETLAPLLGAVPPSRPATGGVVNLDPSGAHRPVFLTA